MNGSGSSQQASPNTLTPQQLMALQAIMGNSQSMTPQMSIMSGQGQNGQPIMSSPQPQQASQGINPGLMAGLGMIQGSGPSATPGGAFGNAAGGALQGLLLAQKLKQGGSGNGLLGLLGGQ